MNYPNEPGFKESETSKAAAQAVSSRAIVLRDAAFNALRQGPKTADEVAAALNESVLAIRPRISELSAAGRVRKTGDRRTNVSGMTAHVWMAA
jgi:predicted transcriptional regulator